MRKAVLFISILLAIAAMHVGFCIPTQELTGSMARRILDSHALRFDYVRVENRGGTFSLFENSARPRVLSAVLAALSGITLAALFLSLVDRRYTLQLIMLTFIVAPSLTRAGEWLLLGYQCDYFQIRFDGYAFPAFNVSDVAGGVGWLLLYGLVLLRFFRWLPEPQGSLTEEPGFGDPFYDRRKPLRLFLGALMVIGIPLVLLQFAALLLGQIQTDGRLASVFWLGVNAFTVLLVVDVWFAIPNRRIGALVLRGFAGDTRGWPIVRSLQKSAHPSLRLTGVVDPRESRRFTHLLYWLLMPFVFGIGDMGRVNAFRYNVFLTEEWQADLKCLFATVQYAIFDCRTLSPNVAWEINLAREMFPADRVFFLANCNIEALRKDLAKFQCRIEMDSAQFFTVVNWRSLSDTLLSRI